MGKRFKRVRSQARSQAVRKDYCTCLRIFLAIHTCTLLLDRLVIFLTLGRQSPATPKACRAETSPSVTISDFQGKPRLTSFLSNLDQVILS